MSSPSPVPVLAVDHEAVPSDGRSRPISVGIMGTPVTSGNRGVLALGAGLARLCFEAAPSVQVTLFGSHPKAGEITMRPLGKKLAIPLVHWRMSPTCAPRDHLLTIMVMSLAYRCVPIGGVRRKIAASIPWIGALVQTDLVGDVRGGDSFSDIYGMKRFVTATLPVLSVIWVKGGIVQFPQTYGPFKSRTSRWIARRVLRRSSVIIARDRESRRIAQELVGARQEVLLSPDVAFALYSEPMDLVQMDGRDSQPLPADPIGLNVNGLMFNGGYTGKNMFGLKMDYRSFLTELASRLLAAHPGELLLVPHTISPAGDLESDNDASRLLRESLPPELQRRVRIVTGDYDAHQLKGIIARCSFFVGSRMHSCIAALSQGVPCVGVAYSMKFRGVFESVGMADWVVDGRDTANAAAVESILGLYAQRQSRRADLGRQADEARAKLKTIFAGLLRSAQPGSKATESKNV